MGLHSAHLHFLLYTKPIGSAMKAVFRSACRKGESFSCVVWGAACGLSLLISACHGFLCGRGGGERERERSRVNMRIYYSLDTTCTLFRQEEHTAL